MASEKPNVKVMGWFLPRGLSSVFARSIYNIDGMKMVYEPFLDAALHGPERLRSMPLTCPEATFESATNYLRSDFLGYKYVFAKTYGVRLRGRLGDATYIPEGWTHTFQIRNPKKIALSWHKLMHAEDVGFPAEGVAGDLAQIFTTMWDIYHFVKNETGDEPLIIDADDLRSSPEIYLREYCRRTNLPYSDKLVYWEGQPFDKNDFFNDKTDWHQPFVRNMIKSNGFIKETLHDDDLDERVKELSNDDQDVIESHLPIYRKLYAKRYIAVPQ